MTDLLDQRLHNQLLTRPTSNVEATVRHIGAIQAQDLPAALWAIGVRTADSTVSSVKKAFNDGKVVRSWPMRGTLHVVIGTDLHWMLSLTADRLIAGAARRREALQLDDRIIEHARSLAQELLRDNKTATRAEFLSYLEDHGIAVSGQRGYHLIWNLAQTGTFCWGPFNDAGDQLLVLLDEWVPQPTRYEIDEALAEFFIRYLNGHAPATLADFVSWSKLTLTQARRAAAICADRVILTRIDEIEYYRRAEVELPAGASLATSYALPGFDEYYLGYADRSAIATPTVVQGLVPGNNGIFRPMILQNGRVVGTWKRAVTRAGISITVTPLDTPLPSFDSLALLGETIARFWKIPFHHIVVE
ncbi:winged helix DNA-binding domain-containing protein [Klugiella xanthotipulae]|uniref:Winged helix DNA-binding protein n=1 Tax=Klugiella xanthotipulae TaxID=244735 RepID=A0A543HSS5_9MICO|nr:winged helix DNA-binding domain-containing protein [Klugiella xanthotipulae]TQM61391.1 winged helix DNA-binding protein [Klugiella xanthotipulae]